MGKRLTHISGVALLTVVLGMIVALGTQEKPKLQPRLIPIPAPLADDFNKALETEARALQLAQETPAYKDYFAAMQQRLRIEAVIVGEVGCRPSQAKLLRTKEGKADKVECADAKE